METYVWEGSASEGSIRSLLERLPNRNEVQTASVEQYSMAVTRMHNGGIERRLNI